MRLESLTWVATPLFSILLLGVVREWQISWGTGFFALLGALAFQISVNALNDVEDYLRLIDLPGNWGGSQVIQRGWVSAQHLKTFGYLMLALGVVFGMPAVLKSPQVLLTVGAMAFLGVLTYSNRPFGMKYRALGDFSIFLLLGPLMALGFSQAVFSLIEWPVLALGIFYGLLSWAVYHSGNLQDIELDQRFGVRTLAGVLGFKKSRHLLAQIYGLAFLVLGVSILRGDLPAWTGLTFGVAGYQAFRLTQRVYRASGPASALLSSLKRDAIRFQLQVGVLIWLSLSISFIYL
jgi:1,4-dihydroxy-2-naphthoate octaprenyltransferase